MDPNVIIFTIIVLSILFVVIIFAINNSQLNKNTKKIIELLEKKNSYSDGSKSDDKNESNDQNK